MAGKAIALAVLALAASVPLAPRAAALTAASGVCRFTAGTVGYTTSLLNTAPVSVLFNVPAVPCLSNVPGDSEGLTVTAVGPLTCAAGAVVGFTWFEGLQVQVTLVDVAGVWVAIGVDSGRHVVLQGEFVQSPVDLAACTTSGSVSGTIVAGVLAYVDPEV